MDRLFLFRFECKECQAYYSPHRALMVTTGPTGQVSSRCTVLALHSILLAPGHRETLIVEPWLDIEGRMEAERDG